MGDKVDASDLDYYNKYLRNVLPLTNNMRLICRNMKKRKIIGYRFTCQMSSVTRLGDILDFGQPFKAFGNN